MTKRIIMTIALLLTWGVMAYLFGGWGFFLFLALLLVIGLAGADGEDGYD